MADSLEKLCKQTGIDVNGLRITVDEYNKACEKGRDELFHKQAKYLRPIKQPTFYAGRFSLGGFGSLGGIDINHKTEVLTKEHEVITGLYAAGTDANNIYGDTYPIYLAGNTMAFAINSGRMAAENALEYIKATGK
jgi:fumarate reductase flavoprotein subunit